MVQGLRGGRGWYQNGQDHKGPCPGNTPPITGSTSAAQAGQNARQERVLDDTDTASAALQAQGGTGPGSTPPIPGSACATAASREDSETNTADPDDKGKEKKKRRVDLTREELRESWRLAQAKTRRKKAGLGEPEMTPEELENQRLNDMIARLNKQKKIRLQNRDRKRAQRAREAAAKKAEEETREKAEQAREKAEEDKKKAEEEARAKALKEKAEQAREAREKAEQEKAEEEARARREKADQEARAKALEEKALPVEEAREKAEEKRRVAANKKPDKGKLKKQERDLFERVVEEESLVAINVPPDGNCLFVSILFAFICGLAVKKENYASPTGAGWLLDTVESYFNAEHERYEPGI